MSVRTYFVGKFDDDDSTLDYIRSTNETLNPQEGEKVTIGPQDELPEVVSFCTVKEVEMPYGIHFSNPENAKHPDNTR